MSENKNAIVTVSNKNDFVMAADDLKRVMSEWNNYNPYITRPYGHGIFSKPVFKDDKTEEKPEEWIWVTGYKGTDRNMKCKNDYQFEIGAKFDMPEGAVIEECRSGFHFCAALENVFRYYPIRNGHRFFEVSALVRKCDCDAIVNDRPWQWSRTDKLAAKSIIFTKELTVEEVLTANRVNHSDWTEEEKTKAMEDGIDSVKNARRVGKLTALGYSSTESLKAVSKVEITADMDVEAVLKLALKNMSFF